MVNNTVQPTIRNWAYNSKDRSGLAINDWTIVSYHHTDRFKKAKYLCRCICGTERVLNIRRILNGASKSCGCKNIANHITHGKSKSRIYNIWQNMKNRCMNPKAHNYKWYGGRGISVCQEWLDSFEAFMSSVGKPPTKNHTIDRIDNNGNYQPDNVRWATMKEQSNNRRLPEPPKE